MNLSPAYPQRQAPQMIAPCDLSVASYSIHKGIGTDRRRDLDHTPFDLGLIAVQMDDAGQAHGWHGNLLLVRNALVQEAHRLVLPGLEVRGRGFARRVCTSWAVAQFARGKSPCADQQDRSTRKQTDPIAWRAERLARWGAALQTLGQHFQIAEAKPSFLPRYPHLALDRMMLPPHGELIEVTAHDNPLSRRASYHLSIKARLRLGGISMAMLS